MIFKWVKPLSSMFGHSKDHLKLGAGPNKDSTFSAYLGGDMNREEAMMQLDSMLTSAWFNTSEAQPMVDTLFKIAFYN